MPTDPAEYLPALALLLQVQAQQRALQQGSSTGTGSPGKSAYDVAAAAGFTGTQAEWLASLKGAKGDKGDKGDSGVSGLQLKALTKLGDPLPVLGAGEVGAYELPSNDARVIGAALLAPGNSTAFVFILPQGAAAGQTLTVAFAYSPGSGADYQNVPAGATGLATSTIGTTTRLEVSTVKLTADHIAATGTGGTQYPYGSVSVSPSFSGAQRAAAFALVTTANGTPKAAVVQSTTSNGTSITPPPIQLDKRSLVFTGVSKRATSADLSTATQPAGQAMVGNVKTGTSAGGESAVAVGQYVPVQVPGTLTPQAWTIPASTNVFAFTLVIPAA